MRRGERPSPSMIVALLALFVALGGTAAAATVLITSSAQIRDGAVRRPDLSAGVLRSMRSTGERALEAFRAGGPENVGAGQAATVATLRGVKAGSWAIFAKTVLAAPGEGEEIMSGGEAIIGHCVLDAAGDTDEAFAGLGSPGALAPGGLALQMTRTFTAKASTVTLRCDVPQESWRASNTSIIAFALGSAPRQDVGG